MSEKVCVIGLGKMGGAIAARLVTSGYEVQGYDLSNEARVAAKATGVAVADSLAAATAGVSAILTSLPHPQSVRDAWLGADGVVAGAPPDALLVELSTIDPETMRSVAAAGADAGHLVVDAPVTGGPGNARAGTLGMIVGGEARAIEAATPLLSNLGPVHHIGDIGSAKVVKIVNNMMSMNIMWVAAEAFAVGIAAGIEPQKLYDVLSVGGGRSNQFVKHFQRAIARDYTPSFSIDLGKKDLALALDLSRSLGVPTPASAVAHDMYGIAMAEGLAGKDKLVIYELYRRWADKD